MRALAKELIGLKPELIISTRLYSCNIVDPVGSGSISNMARPGGNVTGFLNFEFSLVGKWLGLSSR